VQSIEPEQHAQGLRLSETLGIPRSDGLATARHGSPSAVRALEARYDSILQSAPRLADWLQNADHAAIAQDDLESLRDLHDALSDMRDERSWLGEMSAAGGEGFDGLEAGLTHLMASSGAWSLEEAARKAAAANREIQTSIAGRSTSTRRFFEDLEQAEGLDALGVALSDPAHLLVFAAGSFGHSAPALGGALAGSVGGPLSAGAGAFAGGTVAEMGAWINQEIARSGRDVTDAAQILSAYQDPEFMARVLKEAALKGITTGAIDAVSAVFAGGLVNAARGQGGRAVSLALGREVVAQSAAEVVGEGLGQIVATGADASRMDGTEALLEGVASLGQTVGEIGIGATLRTAKRPVIAGIERRARAQQDAQAVRGAVTAWSQSKTAQRLPAALRDFVASQIAGQQGEVVAASIDRDDWDAHFRGQGQSPVEALERVLPTQGAAKYHEAASTGALEIPLGSFIEELAGTADGEALLRLARFRPGGANLAEAEAEAQAGNDIAASFEQEVEASTVLFQEERKLQRQVRALDQEIERLEDEAMDSLTKPDEGPAEAEGQPATGEPDGPAPGVSRLSAARDERQEALTHLETIESERTATGEAVEQLRAAALQGAAAAGHSPRDAQLSAQVHIHAMQTLATRAGMPLQEFLGRFPVRFGGATTGKAASVLAQPVGPEQPSGADVSVEIAPDPRDGKAVQAWNKLAPEQKVDVSNRVAARVVPMVLKEAGATGEIHTQRGGWKGAGNPSIAVRVETRGAAVGVAKALGEALDQEAMFIVAKAAAPGLTASESVIVHLPDGYRSADIDAFYEALYAENDRVVGHSTAEGFMTISGLTDSEARAIIESVAAVTETLDGDFEVSQETAYAAELRKGTDYGNAEDQLAAQGLAEGAPHPSRGARLRREVASILNEELAATREGRGGDTQQYGEREPLGRQLDAVSDAGGGADPGGPAARQQPDAGERVLEDADDSGGRGADSRLLAAAAEADPHGASVSRVEPGEPDPKQGPIVSAENIPGANSGVLTWLHSAPAAVRQEFHEAMSAALRDPATGEDIIGQEMRAAGLDVTPSITTSADSAYLNSAGTLEFNPADQLTGFSSPEDAQLYQLLRGLLTQQEAVAGFSPSEGGSKAGFAYDTGAPPTRDAVQRVFDTLKAETAAHGVEGGEKDFAYFPDASGFVLLHLGLDARVTPEIVTAVTDAAGLVVGLGEVADFAADSFFFANDWSTDTDGENYRRQIAQGEGAFGSPDLLKRVDGRLRERASLVHQEFAARDPGTQQGDGQAPGVDPGRTELDQAKRGQTAFGEPDDAGRRVFDLSFFSRANRSTWFHELGHVYLQILEDLAGTEGAPQQLREDHQAVRAWMGLADGQPIERQQHEQFARGFESYLREGQAPTAALRRVFAAFASWLRRIYKSATELDVELSDDVRAIMGRLLATDEAIEAAQYEVGVPSLPAEVLAGMTEAERASYAAQASRAQDMARERITRDELASLAAQRRAERGQRMKTLRAEEQRLLNEQPAMRALAHLQDGKQPDGSPLPDGTEDAKLARADIHAAYGEGSLEARLLEELGVLAEKGMTADTAASSAGLPSGDALIQAMLALRDPGKVVDHRARVRLRNEFPELLSTREIRTLARKAVANGERALLLEREARQLRREMRRQQRVARDARIEAAATGAARSIDTGMRTGAFDGVAPLAALRARAEKLLAPLPLKEIRPYTYLARARSQSNRAADLARNGSWQLAAQAKDHERFNHELYRVANRMLKEADVDVGKLRFYGDKGAQKTFTRAGHTYKDQANAILERFEFRTISRPEAERRGTLAEWVTTQREQGLDVLVPEHVLNEAFRADHQSLTVEQLHGIRTTLDAIYHLAKTKDVLLKAQRWQTRREAALAIANQASASKPPRPVVVGAETGRETFREKFEGVLAGGVKAGYLARQIDGGEDGGPAVTLLVRPLNEATDEKAILQRQTLEAYAALYKTHFSKAERGNMNRRYELQGVPLSHQDRLSVLGHMGNLEGRQRVRQVLSPGQLQAVLASFTQADVAFASDRAALFDQLFSQVVAIQERLVGQTPLPVTKARLRLQTTDAGEVDFAGSYLPLAYKDERSLSSDVVDGLASLKQGRTPASMMQMGFTKDRLEVVHGRLRLDVGVEVKHLLDTTHAITMREAVLDVQGILGDRDLKQAVQSHYGKAAYGELSSWLGDVANNSGAAGNPLEQLLAYLRQGTVVANLGFRAKSALMQLFGVKNAMLRIGPKWVLLGTRRLLRSPLSMNQVIAGIAAKSKFMAERPKGSFQRELQENRQKLPSTLRDSAHESAFWMLSKSQQVADAISWLAQYEKSMAEMPRGAELASWELEVIARADQAVKDSQSGGQTVDMSWWERGTPLLRILTTYFTEAGLKFNLTRLKASQTKWREPGSFAKFLAEMGVLYFTEAVVLGFASAAWASSNDEERDWEDVIGEMVRDGGASVFDTAPLLRELGGTLQGYQSGPPAGLGAVDALSDVLGQIRQGEVDAGLWRTVNMLGGSVLQYPARAMNEAAEAVHQVLSGEAPSRLLGVRPRR